MYLPILTPNDKVVAYAEVDDRDEQKVRGSKWCITQFGDTPFYIDVQTKRPVALPIVILGLRRELYAGYEFEFLFLNGSPLDCTRRNVRLLRKERKVPLKGAIWDPSQKSWISYTYVSSLNRYIKIGHYDTEYEAALAAKKWKDELPRIHTEEDWFSGGFGRNLKAPTELSERKRLTEKPIGGKEEIGTGN